MYLFIYTKNDHMISILIVFGVINVNSYFDIFFIGPFFAPKTIKKFGAKNGPMLVFFINLFVFGGNPKKALIHGNFCHCFWCQNGPMKKMLIIKIIYDAFMTIFHPLSNPSN